MKKAKMRKFSISSRNGKFRFYLSRTWDDSKNKLLWIMLNPSTASSVHEDLTLSKCIKFSKNLGYGGLAIVNLFALVSDDPEKLKKHYDPVGSNEGTKNDEYIDRALSEHETVILAWGAKGTLFNRDEKVLSMVNQYNIYVMCLGLNKNKTPKHPGRLPYSTKFETLNAGSEYEGRG